MKYSELLSWSDENMPEELNDAPTHDEELIYRKVMSYHAKADLWDRLLNRVYNGTGSVTKDNIHELFDSICPSTYDDFDDQMASAFWERMDNEIDSAIAEIKMEGGKND